MTVFDERPARPSSRRRLWLLTLPALAALVWFGQTVSLHGHHLRQTLHEFRGDTTSDSEPNTAMASALKIRELLLRHPHSKLSSQRIALLVSIVQNPVNDQSQSEALDVLSMAKRAEALSAGQAATAQEAAITVLRTSPGPMVRLESARLLGHLGNEKAVPALTSLQSDLDPKIRQAAETALAQISRN